MKYFFTLFIALLALPGISQSTAARPVFNDGYDYNDYIVEQQDVVGAYINEFNALISDPASTKSQVNARRIEMLAKARQCESNVRNMPDWQGNTSLRDSALVCFKFYVRLFEVDYVELINLWFTEPYTETEAEKVDALQDRIIAEEDRITGMLTREQEKFGAQFGLIFEEKPSEK